MPLGFKFGVNNIRYERVKRLSTQGHPAFDFGPTQQKCSIKIEILAIVFLQEKGRVRTSLLHSVGGRNNDPFSFMTENYVKQGFVLARNIPKYYCYV